MSMSIDEKLKEYFDEMVVFKDLKKSNFFSALSLPSFLRDWLLKKFEDSQGEFNVEDISAFIKTYIPSKNEWTSIKNRIVYENEHVKFLTKISIDISIKTQEISFSLPDFGLTTRETIIEPNVWESCKDELVNGKDTWGVVELGYKFPDEEKKIPGKIKLISFTNFCPYTVDLEYFKDVRKEFTVQEWLDVILGAIDYNAGGYENEDQKRSMITRLLPFVEKRINLIELAPKGTGKSYLFGGVSRFGYLASGVMSRSKLFFDLSRRTKGLVYNYDYVAFDEIQKLAFVNSDEISSTLKGYMEQGTISFGGHEGSADAGIILLGNIMQENMDEYKNMFVDLPTVFKESALLDRFHGFIRGWDIPRMHDDLKISGWALNSEYFCTMLHLLREDASYRAIVDQILEVPERADTRDTEAIKRIATGYLKLLFPHVRSPKDINSLEFTKYCLRPATKMRQIIKMQLGILDTEYKGKDVPTLTVRSEYGN